MKTVSHNVNLNLVNFIVKSKRYELPSMFSIVLSLQTKQTNMYKIIIFLGPALIGWLVKNSVYWYSIVADTNNPHLSIS